MTKVYGASDDLIEIEGDYKGEVGCYDSDEEKSSVLLVFSDGTLLKMWYCDEGIWCIHLMNQGTHFDNIQVCTDPEAKVYSDVATFKCGIKWVYAAPKWEKVH